ncbi:FecR domain-containing protein [Pikeienuella piscinae]|uniref:FecR domain-containing protein n=1 Tax=Pikeienuella piscinae TaxID=2748098 RepID=A0A7M3T6M8_9RHOB|nr:FecR family protein [Pikeienuella piscinae]QIE57659.1 FecR domain-containing protein [Pikeienuella piscinae]
MSVITKAAVAAIATLLVATPLGAQERAGRATAVQPAAFQATGAVGYAVKKNAEIYQQARVYTKQYGTIEIRLEDGTNLTVAPNASLVIDDYVFAGETRPGSLALSLSRGAIRMVSGRMPKDGVAVTTPVATIGVRGTTIWVSAASEQETEVWVTDGIGIVSTRDSAEVYELTAPAHATCSASGCEVGGSPPVPMINPLGRGTGAGGGFGGDREPEPEREGHSDRDG